MESTSPSFIEDCELPLPPSNETVDFIIDAIVIKDSENPIEKARLDKSCNLNGDSTVEMEDQVQGENFLAKLSEKLDEIYINPTRPRCLITGVLDSSVFPINKPLTGEITIVTISKITVMFVEVLLLGIEICGEGYKPDVSVIQATKIVKGNVVTGKSIPIHMVFSKLLTCPTVNTSTFKIGYAVKVKVVLKDNVENHQQSFSETIPIKIVGVTL